MRALTFQSAFGYAPAWLRRYDAYIRYTLASSLLLTLVLMWGCAAQAIKAADSAYMGWRIATETGAQIIQSPEISDATKAKVQAAARAAQPLAEGLWTALYSAATAPPENKASKLTELQQALLLAVPALTAYARAVAEAQAGPAAVVDHSP